jgi:HEAT repeat protein
VRSKRFLAVLGVVAVGLAAAGWFGRGQLQARYYAFRLMNAADGDVSGWVEQAGSWGHGVPERLLDLLERDEATICGRGAAALAHLAGTWPAGDPRRVALAEQLAERFPTFRPPGQQAALDCAAALTDEPSAVRSVLRLALDQADPAVRVRAAALALRADVGAPELLVPRLHDPSAEVRRAALLAVGPSRELIADDDLLPCLHDPDAEVRRLCELALRGRGLRAQDVRLARLLTDPKPSARLQLLTHLRGDDELDLSAWLQRLSQDSSPAVRAAAARLAGERQVMPLANRLAQMAQNDPDLTVRPIARYHLQQLQTVRPVGAIEP